MKRLLALLIPLVLSGGPALAAAPTPHHGATRAPRAASRDRQPTGRSPVSVVLNTVTPRYLQRPSEVLRIEGLLRNQSDDAYPRVSVRIRYDDHAVTSRGAMAAYADDRGFDPPRKGRPQPLPAGLRVGGQQAWSLTLPVKEMGLRPSGVTVYPISVEVLSAVGTVLGRQRTFVTYAPKGAVPQKTRISWVWPVIDRPHRADDATFVDDRLERQFNGGRLSRLVTAGARAHNPVSWLLDPGLVDDATVMAGEDGYTVKGGGRRGRSVAAEGWLTSLRNAIGTRRVLATPYADPDVMGLSHNGLARDIKAATDVLGPTLAQAHIAGSAMVAVPPDGLADQQTLTNLVASGARTILLDSTLLPDYRAQTYTPDPLTRKNVSGTNVNLIATDDTLTHVLGTDTGEPGGAALTEQRFLAETAMITGERPNDPRSVVVMPPRRWNPDPALAERLLRHSASTPWLRAVALKNVEAMRPSNRAFQPPRESANSAELSRRYLRQVKELSGRVRRFTSIFQPPVSGFTLGIARVESSAWADQTRRGAALHGALAGELARSAGKIRVLHREASVLAGKTGQIPLTISNGLTRGTVRVRLHAYSQNDTRLRVTGGDHDLTLEAGHKNQVTLHMNASANGLAFVNVELLAADGQPFGETTVLQVRTTGYGRTALVIIGVSLAVLFLGVGVRVIRRRGGRAEDSSG